MAYEVWMHCRSGTKSLHENPLRWEDDMHTIRWSTYETWDEATDAVDDLTPAGFNRERISLWITEKAA